MSLRSKITVAFAMCISLPLVTGMGSLWLGTESQLLSTAETELKFSTQSATQQLESRLASNLAHLKAWSNLPTMQNVLIGDEGSELLRTVNELSLEYPDFTALTITNAQGQVVVTSDPAQRKADLSSNVGVQSAISGRIYQSDYSVHRTGGTETIWFTVPLIAHYDRRSVIGTLTGALDLSSILKSVTSSSSLGRGDRMLVVAEKKGGRVIFNSKPSPAILEALKEFDLRQINEPQNFIANGFPFVASAHATRGIGLSGDPGFVIFGTLPTSYVFAAADQISNIFLISTGIASVLALILAWKWSTPLINLSSAMNRVARGETVISAPQLPSNHTFAPIASAVDALRDVVTMRDRLEERERDLMKRQEEMDVALKEKSAQYAQLTGSLKAQLSSIMEIADLINKENLAAASGRMHVTYARELSRSSAKLMSIVDQVTGPSLEPPQRKIA